MSSGAIHTNGQRITAMRALQQRRSDQRPDRTVKVQRRNANGAWGRPFDTQRVGDETAAAVIDRLTQLNPGKSYRLAGDR